LPSCRLQGHFISFKILKVKKLCLLCYLFVTVQIVAQTGRDTLNFLPPAIPPSVFAVETTEDMAIDGKLTEAVWQRAPVVSDFFRIEPRQGGEYQYKTRVQVAFDKRNLYFGVFCKDSLGKKGVRVQDFRRDFNFGENDIFFLQLDPQNLKRYCVSFQTTPLSTQRDLQAFDDSFRDNNWDSPWRVRTSVVDIGYFAEFAIPFNTLRYDRAKEEDSTTWGITFSRLARRDYEQTVFPAIPQAFSPYRMTYAAQLKGLKLPPPSVNLRFQPYVLGQFLNNRNEKGITTKDNDVKLGGEVKWAMNAHSVLDLTFNTDFAQADVDRAVNNLTRFNVFFPERRQFFLENSGIFSGVDGGDVIPFFSRSIGLANSQFNANPVPIDAGVRFTDRTQKRTIAGLYVHQQQTEQQAGANFSVFRYLHNYGKQNNIGAMLTHRFDEKNTEKGFNPQSNTTLTIDGLIRPKDDITIQYLVSTGRDTSFSDKMGHAGSLFVGYTPNDWYLGWVTKWVTQDYNPAMGFVFQHNTIWHNPGGYYIWRPKSEKLKWIRRYDPGMFVNYYQNADNGRLQQAELYIFPIYTFFSDNSKLEYAIFPTWQNVEVNFAPLSIPIAQGRYFYTKQQIAYSSDASKKVSASVKYEWGGYFNGRLQTFETGIRIAPIPHIAFTCDYEFNNLQNVGVAEQDLKTHLVTGGLRLAANPRLQVSAFYQYNSFDQRGRWNVRGSWEFTPLSYVYVVFNENNFQNSLLRNQSVISKVTYLKQF
jgi:hypothetical protein